MDLKERLLQNEIQHLGQIIQTLSYELIVLQDFLTEEYGSKFESYRSKYSSENEASSSEHKSRISRTRKIPNMSGTTDCSTDHAIGSTSETLVALVAETQPLGTTEDSQLSEFINEGYDLDNEGIISDNDDMSYDEFDPEATTLRDPLDTATDGGKGGRKKTKVWKYFDTVRLSNNRLSARCHICQGLVSARAPRMVEHRLKCKRILTLESKPRPSKKGYISEVNQEMKVMKVDQTVTVGMNDNIDNPTPDQSDQQGNTGTATEDSKRVESTDNSTSRTHKKANTGRSLDVIWTYFQVSCENNLRKAKCVSCGQLVSPKAGRMRQHKSVCIGSGLKRDNTSKTGNVMDVKRSSR